LTKQNLIVKQFMLNALLNLGNDAPEVLAIFNDKLYGLGDLIKQRDPELFDEIIRTISDQVTLKKIKIQMNRSRRTKN